MPDAQPKPTAAEIRAVTTDYVRTVYARCPVDSLNGGRPNPTPDYAAQQFDRWLAEHDAQVAAQALREAAEEVGSGNDPYRPASATARDLLRWADEIEARADRIEAGPHDACTIGTDGRCTVPGHAHTDDDGVPT